MNLIAYIKENIDPDFASGDLPFVLQERVVPKNTIITNYGDVENNIYYLESGLVEVLFNNDKEDKVLDFFFPASFFCAYNLISTLISKFRFS